METRVASPSNTDVCPSQQDLTNPDYCGVGVLGSFTAGAGILLFHQISLAIHVYLNRRKRRLSIHLPQSQKDLPEKQRFDLRNSVVTSSISLFDTASVLAISWGVAAVSQLATKSSVQTTHDAVMICLTAYASNVIALGALCTSWQHIRRHRYRFCFMLFSLLLCASVTGLAAVKIHMDKFPMEVCLPFFTEYLPQMRKYFVVLSGVFWGCSSVMLILLGLAFHSPQIFSDTKSSVWSKRKPNWIERTAKIWGLCVVVVVELVLLVMTVLVNHYFIPEQLLREQAGGELQEGQWTFGQIIGMLIWLPVVAEFIFAFFFGIKRGLEGQLPVYFVVEVAKNHARVNHDQDHFQLI